MSGDTQTLADVVGAPSTPTSEEYLKHLTTLPLPDLLAEPTLLQTQAHYLTSSLVTLAHTSYPTFLAVHQSNSALNSSLNTLSTSLDTLVSDSLPALEQRASDWKNQTESVLKERKRARVVLEQHEKLRDLLDIPLLIDTCVRNGYFGEALSLAAHARSLATLFDNDGSGDKGEQGARSPPVLLSSIIAEVDQSITQMLVSLLATLHEPHRKLPALFKAVNFLRRMNVFGGATNSTSPTTPIPSPVATKVTGKGTDLTPGHTLHGASTDETIQAEQQLALAFLSGRETCLVASLDGCGRNIQGGIYELQATPGEGRRQLEERELEDIARYLKKYIDTWREAAYDIVTQYSTIFLERSPLPSNPPPTKQQLRELHTSLHSLLSTYATHSLTKHLVPILTSALPLLAPPALPSLLTQLTYCASAFGRVGLDFRGLLADIMGKSVVAVVRRDIQAAGNVWAQELLKSYEPEEIDDGKTDTTMSRSKSSGNKSGVRVNRVPSKWLISPSLVASPPRPLPSGTSNPAHIPPPLLASYPPLAVFTNALLTTLNGLRLLAPLHVKDALIRVMDEEMVNGGQALLRFAEAVGADEKLEEGEVNVVRSCGEVYFGVFAPFMKRALVEGVYGAKAGDGDENLSGQLVEVTRNWDTWISSLPTLPRS
ncbi:Dor1-domain-containing protein [Pleurotus eryngii]|uniref:Conserved oligomeric Golgi complex subunit 8 n=1 Tax=Pleurotus eryngii TaxID=5323 RepID=A0A9P5ZRE2_PLEER|nr:Dor1-domain-containing protein [Pleurotus eryngii]